MDNTKNEVKVNAIQACIASLKVGSNYRKIDVFAKKRPSADAHVRFESREFARQFIADNMEAFKDFKAKGRNEESRELFWSLYRTPVQWKLLHASRLLAKYLSQQKDYNLLSITINKNTGVITIDDFDVVKLKVDASLRVEHKLLLNNITT